jgi:hypothetical protein
MVKKPLFALTQPKLRLNRIRRVSKLYKRVSQLSLSLVGHSLRFRDNRLKLPLPRMPQPNAILPS